MSLLTHNSTPAERARGCTLAETLESPEAVAQNGGTVSGAPDIDFGATLDGTDDYLSFAIESVFDTEDSISIVVEFSPGFAHDDGADHYLFDCTAGNRYLVYKTSASALTFFLGNTNVASVAAAAYYANWLVNQRNVLVVSGTSGNTNAWLNGVQIVTADATAWTPAAPTVMTIGANNGGGNKYEGVIYSLHVFSQLLTAQEALDYYNNTTYTYENECSLHLPMGAAQHDPTNVRTLDVSGNARHATFGDGSTPTTYPTKIARHHGYDLDGGDYLAVTGTGIFNGPGCTIVFEFTPDFDPDDGPNRRFYDSSGSRFLVYISGADGAMTLYAGGTVIETIALAVYAPYWRKGARNIFVFSAIPTVSNAWLNGTPLITNDVTAWANGEATVLYLGSSNGAVPAFDGKMHSFCVWRKALTPLQIHDLTIRTLGKVNDV